MLEHLASAGDGYISLYVMFITGVLTAANPCMAALAPAVAGYAGRHGKSRGYGLAVAGCLIAGFAGVLALLGLSASITMGWLAPLRGGLPYFLGITYVLLGWYMVSHRRFLMRLPVTVAGFYCRKARSGSWYRWVRGSLPGAFLLGAGLGITPSPCVTPVAMSVLAYASASGEVARGAALLFAFGLGHGIILFLLAAFAGVLQGMVRWRAWLRLLNPLMGLSLMGFGFYLLTWGRHLFQHTM